MFTSLLYVVWDPNVVCSMLCTARSAITGSCENDGVHIIRGHSPSSTPVATVCGDETLAPMTLTGPVLLNFYSNAHITDLGFKFSYSIIRE
jgi:cubilin